MRSPPAKISKSAAKTRSAVAVAEQTYPIATRSTVSTKAKTQLPPRHDYLSRPPFRPPRPSGFWDIKPLEKGKAESDHEVIDQTNMVPDPDLAPYWGNVDDESSIHLFDRPMANYLPIKLPGDVWFKDTQEICYYLINFMHYYIK